jgi:hypothetical protein
MYCYLLFKILVHSVLPRLFLAALYFLTFPSVISFLFRISCPAYHSCPAFPVSIFLNNLYTPLHSDYCLPGILLKGLLTFNPCPVPCCPSCLLSCLSQLIYSAKELYPNTQFNIIVQVFIFEFCKLPFCPITAVLMAVLSFVLDILDVLDVLLCLLYHICPVLPVLACFLSNALHSVSGYEYNFTYGPTGTAHAYFKVRALFTRM